jgi:hypothetical protein
VYFTVQGTEWVLGSESGAASCTQVPTLFWRIIWSKKKKKKKKKKINKRTKKKKKKKKKKGTESKQLSLATSQQLGFV